MSCPYGSRRSFLILRKFSRIFLQRVRQTAKTSIRIVCLFRIETGLVKYYEMLTVQPLSGCVYGYQDWETTLDP